MECIVIGEPKDMMNRPSDSTRFIEPIVKQLIKKYPELAIKRFDERFTSKMAHDAMLASGISKSKRQNKSLVDTISATIILQSYMELIIQHEYDHIDGIVFIERIPNFKKLLLKGKLRDISTGNADVKYRMILPRKKGRK